MGSKFWIVVGVKVAVNESLACPSIHIVHTDLMYVFFCSDLLLHNVQTSLRHRARIAISRSVCFNRRPPTTARDVDTRNWKTMRIELQDIIHYIELDGEFIEQRIIW